MAASSALRSFEVIEDDDPPEQPTGASLSAMTNSAAAAGIALALRALSARALVALADLFSLITVGSAFWLWWSIPSPDHNQLISLGMYGVFTLAVNVIVRRRK